MNWRIGCTGLFIFLNFLSFGQWTNETLDNGFDKPFKQSITKENNGCYLKLSNRVVDEERVVSDTKVWFDTVYEFNYSPEYPDGKVDTLIMERREYKNNWKPVSHLNLSIIGNFHCDDAPKVEIVLKVGGENKKYVFTGNTWSDKLGIEIIEDVTANLTFTNDFKKATRLSLRIIDSICEDGYYEFNMSGSSAALTFVQVK
jgi:hypothetical protein